MTGIELVVAFAAAAGLGAAVGLERQVVKGETGTGARTFALYGAWGVAAAYAGTTFGGVAFAALALGFLVFVAAAHVVDADITGDRGTTTEAAQVATFVVGILAHQEEWVAAVILAVATAVILGTKAPIHRFAGRISDEDSRAALQFAVVTGIVLPLVPDEAVGPYGALNLREIWLMVVFVSAIGFVGYVGLRLVGGRSLGLTGVLGGVASSTAVSLGLSRMSRSSATLHPALAAGIIGASALMFPRVLLEAAATAPSLASRLAPVLVVLTLGTGAVAAWWLRQPVVDAGGSPVAVRNPLTLTVAVQFGALYAVIVLVARVLMAEVSTDSLVLLGLVSGVADVDAITLTAGNLVDEGLSAETGARAVLVAAATNTLVKVGLVWMLGTRSLARTVTIALVPAAVLAAGLAFV